MSATPLAFACADAALSCKWQLYCSQYQNLQATYFAPPALESDSIWEAPSLWCSSHCVVSPVPYSSLQQDAGNGLGLEVFALQHRGRARFSAQGIDNMLAR